MKRWTSYLLVLSLLANAVFLGASWVVIDRLGGFGYLAAKLKYGRDPMRYMSFRSLYERLPDDPGEIVFLGDSYTERGRWSEFFPGHTVKNRGIGGDTTAGVLKRLDEVTSAAPSKVFLLIGYNDLSYGVPLEKVKENYRRIIQEIRADSPDTVIYVQSLLPLNTGIVKREALARRITEANAFIPTLADGGKVRFIDLNPLFVDGEGRMGEAYAFDGVHLSGEGYQVWMEALAPHIGPPPGRGMDDGRERTDEHVDERAEDEAPDGVQRS